MQALIQQIIKTVNTDIPIATGESKPTECYTNEISFGEIGHGEVGRYFVRSITVQIFIDLSRFIHIYRSGVNYHGKTASDRELLETINDALEKHSDLPFLDICRYTENLSTLFTGILFVDIRKPENIARFINRFPQTVTVFIDNGKPATNVTFSDSVVKDMKYDYTISNTGTIEQLCDKAKLFVETIMQKETTEK